MGGYEVQINPEKIELLGQSLRKAADNADDLNRKLDGVQRQVEKVGRVRSAGVRSEQIGAGADAPDGPRRTPNNGPRDNTFQWYRGANQQYDARVRALRTALASEDPRMIEDAAAGVRRAEKAKAAQDKLLAGPQPKSRQDLIWDALQTSRVGPGGQLMPLVNRLRAAGLSSPEELSAEFGISAGQAQKLAPAIATAVKAALPLMAGATAAYGAYRLAEASSARIRVGSDAYWLGGGSPATTGQGLALGGPNAAQKALALGDRLREGTYGSAYMRSRGIVDLGPHTIDKMKNYVRSVDALTQVPTDQQAIRIARDLGMEGDLWQRDLRRGDPELYKQLRDSNGLAGTDYERLAEARYRAQKDIFGNKWDKVVRTAGMPAIQQANVQMGGSFGERVGNAARIVARSTPFGPLVDGVASLGDWRRFLPKGSTGRKMFGDPDAPQPSRPQGAPNGHDLPFLPVGREPRVGGGQRAGGAIPPGLAQQTINQKFDFDAVNLGAAGFL